MMMMMKVRWARIDGKQGSWGLLEVGSVGLDGGMCIGMVLDRRDKVAHVSWPLAVLSMFGGGKVWN